MKLADFLAPESDLVFETEFPEEGSGFFMTVKYLPPDEMRRITQETAGRILSVKGGKLDVQDASLEQEIARRIVNWRGLTPEIASTFIAGLKVQSLRSALESEGLTEIPCTDSNKLMLIRKGRGLLAHIDQAATTVANYQQERLEAEIKN